MERTSSLDLFRGSDAFTSLAFLDGQEPSREANSGLIAGEGLQPSQAIPASMPVSSLHSAAPIQRSSELLHTSRLAPGFSAWPQTASNPFPSVAMQQPATARHTFLLFGAPANQHVAGTADCQADSFAALLADDTALGFADDCFRRESDLYLSQDRALPAEIAYHDGLQSNSSLTEQLQDMIPASTPSTAVALATQSTASESVRHHPTVAPTAVGLASAQSALIYPADVAAAPQALASAEPPVITNLDNLSPPVIKHSNPPAAYANMTTADTHIPGTEPQAAHDQLQTAYHNAGQTQPDVPDPTQVELRTSTGSAQAHTAQAFANSSLVAAPTAGDAVANSLGACKSMSSKLAEPLLRPPQHSAQTSSQAVMSPESATAPCDAPDSCAQALLEDGHPHATELQATPAQVKADLHGAAVSDSQAASQDCQLETASQVQGPIRQQQKLSSGQTGVVRPKLAVQDYQLPLLQTARGMPGSEAQSQQDTSQSTEPAPDATASGGVHTCVPQDAIDSWHRGDSSGVHCYKLPAEHAHCDCILMFLAWAALMQSRAIM